MSSTTPDRVDSPALQLLLAQLQACTRLEQLTPEHCQSICEVFGADRLSLYLPSADRKSLVSRIKTGLDGHGPIRLPITPQSLAGYAALTQQTLNLANVYDTRALKKINPDLRFLGAVDMRSGYRTRQMLVTPLRQGGQWHGVLQLINQKDGQPFSDQAVSALVPLCQVLCDLVTATVQPLALPAFAEQAAPKANKYASLVQHGYLTSAELAQCHEAASRERRPMQDLLVESFQLQLVQIGLCLASFFGVPYEPFKAGRLRSDSLHALAKREFMAQQGWLPLAQSAEGLVVMCLDPVTVRESRAVMQIYPAHPHTVYRVTTHAEFKQTLAQFFNPDPHAGTVDTLLSTMDAQALEESQDQIEFAASSNELVRLVNKIIVDAYEQGASDIHIEPMPGRSKTGIRFRIDGTLVAYAEVPAPLRQPLVTRLKIMCDLDISERRKPQDGKIRFKKYGPLDIELRVATIPTAGGLEDVVMRILVAGESLPLDQIGLNPLNQARLVQTVTQPYGLFYVCGPTGSGKTTTLHAILKHLNNPDTKIWTVEDPVEITQKGLRQVQINRKAGIDFALVMRAFLRADPDIIMVGESRDRETVAMGIEASLTGHLVFSTLHTNSAAESITRLLDMGMDPFNFADALVGVLAQRLTKKLCICKEAYTPDADELQRFVAEYANDLRHSAPWQLDAAGESERLLQSWTVQYGQPDPRHPDPHHPDEPARVLLLYRAKGCARCNHSGYKGRLALHELLIADNEIKRQIHSHARVADLLATALDRGMHTLKMDGMDKVLQGLTDLKMVRVVCIQ